VSEDRWLGPRVDDHLAGSTNTGERCQYLHCLQLQYLYMKHLWLSAEYCDVINIPGPFFFFASFLSSEESLT